MWNALDASVDAVACEGRVKECNACALYREFLAQGRPHADELAAILAVHEMVGGWCMVLIVHLEAGTYRTTQSRSSFPFHFSSPSQHSTEFGEVQRSGLISLSSRACQSSRFVSPPAQAYGSFWPRGIAPTLASHPLTGPFPGCTCLCT